jgi:nucleoside-diphosphate-sugar epimerase
MRVGLTGITSGLGLRLAEMLREGGHEVAGLVRDPDRADAKKLAAIGVRLEKGALDDDAALDRTAKGADVFMHLAAHVGDVGPVEEFVRVNVGGTAAAVRAAARSGVKRFVQLSSSAVYGRPDTGRVLETWPTKHSGMAYEDTKTDAERTAFKLGRSLGMEVVAIRPPVIYGPHDRNFMPRAVTALFKRQFVLVDGGTAPLNMVWVDHVSDATILAATKDGIDGEAFNVMDDVSETPPSVRTVAETIADAVGAPRPKLSMPFGVAFALSHVVEGGFRLAKAKKVPPFTPFVVKILTRHVIYDAAKAVSVLGWKPKKRSLDGLREEAVAYAKRMGTGPQAPNGERNPR